MKSFLKYFLYVILSVLFLIYLAFLIVLPNVVKLEDYLPEIQKIVKEQANVDLSVEDLKISTNPLLQAGIKTGKLSVKLPDGSSILEADGLKLRLSIPNLLFYNIKASCAEIQNLNINLDIENGEQFKFVRLIEDILNAKKNEPNPDSKELPIDISKIKYIVPNAKISNYNISVKDLKTGHKLLLSGDKMTGGYFNKETAKLKTVANIYSDDELNITANLDIDSIIPKKKPKDAEDDPAEKIEVHFVNPVLVYRDYDLKSDINAKLKIRKNDEGKLKIKGRLAADDITMNISGYNLPKSYIKAKFKKDYAFFDTNITIAKEQSMNMFGKFVFNKDPKIDLRIFTDKIYFNDLIILSKAMLDTLHIKNNLAYIKAAGYFVARTHFKTDLKQINSSGCIIARDGKVSNGATNLVFDKIRANLIFENDKLNISDTKAYVNGSILKADGVIDTDSYSDITVHSDKLPLAGLFAAFAPSDLKKSISLNSGTILIDANVKGKLKEAVAYANVILSNVGLRNSSFNVNNEKLAIGLVTDLKTVDGNITNKNLTINIPKTSSNIKNPSLIVKLNQDDIDITPFELLVNNNSKIAIAGAIKSYVKNPDILFNAEGYLNAKDLRKFLGTSAVPFVAAEGNLPIKAKVFGDDKKQDIILQVKADASNYITPVDIQPIVGSQTILQAKLDHKKDRLHIKQTGFYTGATSFTNDFDSNMASTRKIAEVNGTIVKLNTNHPFINIIKLDVADDLNAKFTAFKNSNFKIGGKAIVFGKLSSPLMRGDLRIYDLRIPELLTSMNEARINLSGKNIVLYVRRLLLNGSDVNLQANTDINPHPQFTISRLDLRSRHINVDRLLKVTQELSKYTAPSSSNQPSDIPVVIRRGAFNIREIITGNIKAENTTGRISMHDSNLFVQNFDTRTFDGKIDGDITVNLLTMLIDIKTHGEGLNTEKALLDIANVKNAITGNLGFNTDIQIKGNTVPEMMKNLKGNVVFNIQNGQLGPFGKIENMILAENIRESQFFQTALGGVINNLASIDTSRFKTLDGKIVFDNGIAHIDPIVTVGNVMSMHIAGNFDLLQNTLDMKVRAKLGSVIANLLGPLSQLNPINLVQATPGLNVVMAKTFFLFCETLTPEETAALPHLETPLDDKMATKFQIVLRGDVAKPLRLIKSFKWLALASEIESAKNFVSTLPDPSLVEDPANATLENIIKAQEEKAKEDAKLKNKIKKLFVKN